MIEVIVSWQFLAFVVCLIGSGLHSHKIGRREGIVQTIDEMEAKGYLNITFAAEE